MDNIKIIARNKKALHDYFIEDKIECGIQLLGTEVKSLRQGRASIKEAYADIKDNEVYLYEMNIPNYEFGNRNNEDPKRVRKLLLHKKEITKLSSQKQRQGYTLVPLSIYFKNGKVKVELALAKGKKLYDKRHSLKEKDINKKIRQSKYF